MEASAFDWTYLVGEVMHTKITLEPGDIWEALQDWLTKKNVTLKGQPLQLSDWEGKVGFSSEKIENSFIEIVIEEEE